ncbi:AraC family transcriptional regulator [Fulvivirga ligni]|uniref:AraC family transcriptional regulator n=1 Tax=Fulvivirga ligni TaxID=2904246 RepID=UPI001F178033|nr:AraC family transcriptional regulator [Fulvivirga ligni]UII19092.1 AraC family transcriptional regulator [Fulvivirga ligni]
MESNFIIHQHARQYQWSGECFLSVKSFYKGEAHYQVKHKSYELREGDFLILNECSRYNLTIDTPHDTESFCVFFSPDYVQRHITAYCSTDEQLLDGKENTELVKFIEKKFRSRGPVSSLLEQGQQTDISHKSKLEQEEYYQHLLAAIMYENSGAIREADRLDLKRKSTRVEIYERICCARDFMEAYFYVDLSLSEIAAVAALSENHLLRCFKQIFGTTPFKYISHLRIKEAYRQLKETDKAVSDIARSVGYDSMSNFSSYFKAIIGKSASQIKQGDI